MTEYLSDGVIIYDNVFLGKNPDISPYVILGKRPVGTPVGKLKLVIGRNATIRSFTTIYLGSEIGDFFSTGQNVSIREDNFIGNDVSIGTGSSIEFGNFIDDGTRIHSSCFLELLSSPLHPRNSRSFRVARMGSLFSSACRGFAIGRSHGFMALWNQPLSKYRNLIS